MAILCNWGVWSLLLVFLFIPCIRTQDVDTINKDHLHASSDFRRHTIVKPRFYHGREKREISTTRPETGKEHLHDLMIEINIAGKHQILELRLNREFLSGTYFQRHQENGLHKIHRPSKEEVELCQYQGNLRGVSNSWAAVSTCNGLRGVVFDGHELHYLEPKQKHQIKNSEKSEDLGEIYHYRHSDIHGSNHSCGYEGTPHDVLHNEHIAHLHRSKRDSESPDDDGSAIRGPYNANKKTRYVELVLVVDHKEYLELDSSKDKVYQHCKDMANIINALYMPLNIFVALVGVVVWSEFDEISLVPNGDTTLTNFLHYRRERLVKEHPNDNAQLLTRVQFDNGVVGKALKGPICTYEFSGGVSMDHSNVVGLVATTVAHEMGHNFGMEHDSSECSCPSERCIMAPSSSTLSPTHWSSCSEKYLLLAFHHGMDYCLHNKPTKLFGSPVCGNGFVEHGEQCDCGLEDRCSNPCCNATTCMLHANASCATGECCDLETCRPKTAGTVCRSADQECDLPEFCTGKSEYCKEDVFKMDGETCNHGKAFCYHGMCRTRSDQCKLLWGPSGKSSDTQCYKMNTKGSRHGNCGYNRLNQSYVKCVDDNIYCGMLHCKHLNERLEFGMESVSILSHSFINSGGSIIPCRTAIVDLGLNEVDPGLAPDGSKCGEGKMCVNQKCMAVSSLRTGSVVGVCPQNCNGNGVCNSKGNCHCNPGFAPPFCDYPGTGGSKDSGPATDPNAGRKFVFGLYIFFLGIVPSVAIVALAMYYIRPLVKHWWKKPGTIAANGPRHSTKPGGQNRTGRGNSLAFHSLERSGGPKLNGSSGHRDISSPLRSDGTHASLLPPDETPVNSPSTSNGSSPVSNLQISLIGQFKGFSITPMTSTSPTRYVEDPVQGSTALPTANKPALPSPAQSALRKAPVPPSVPSASTAAPAKSMPFKIQGVNKARTNSSVVNGVSSVNNSSVAPALPPANPQSVGRPLISSPILDATTSSAARELVDGSNPNVPVPPAPPAPVRTAPVRTAPVRTAPAVPISENKLSRPASSHVDVVDAPAAVGTERAGGVKQPTYPTLTKLASMLRPSASFRNQEKKEEPQNVKAGKLLDKEKLRSLQISSPIPQTEIEVPHAVPVQPNQPVVMRAQSMRAGANSKRPAIQTFGSMRQPGKRPTSVASNGLHRPTSPPPPRPPPLPVISSKETGISGLPGYQNPPDAKANKLPSDYSYDDCLNVMGDAPLAHIDEENSPTSGDNIYAVIEESPENGSRNRVNFDLPSSSSAVDVPEYISPTASVYKDPASPRIHPAGSSESMGLLGEIVSAIQARNTESIYSSSNIPPKDSTTVTGGEPPSGQDSESPLSDNNSSTGTYFTSASSSSGYLSPNVSNSGLQTVGSVVSALQSPSTAAPAAITTTTVSTTSSAPSESYKPYGLSVRSRGPLANTFSKSNPSSISTTTTAPTPPPASQKPQLLSKKPAVKEKPALASTSPDVVSSCSSSADTASPDVISPASTKSVPIPSISHPNSSVEQTPTQKITVSQSNSSAMSNPTNTSLSSRSNNVRPPVSASKPTLDSFGPNRTLNLQTKAAASKISNVASLQQKFEASPPSKLQPGVKPKIQPVKPSLSSSK
ncbi:disintegrin and metalloproteinase domain-containing protein 19 isoform X2 [Thrips palmi]|uniref:Disintegrin and metalloproteinase domain-containing protein 19 isoform X2 n=1 Tax=Thrips palmi TaxID=161013 RepID=A0A6P9ABR8_THRPL|nr:disintegrin and metalloproteinase domain-containing protein 19 isoform X2 [Thrips palmi]